MVPLRAMLSRVKRCLVGPFTALLGINLHMYVQG
jgi:hypothetical protein